MIFWAFWIWSVLGFLINVASWMGMPSTVGVGLSAYIMAGTLFWIGGMVMLGLGAVVNAASRKTA